MITLKEPIKLQSTRFAATVPQDSFYHRISQNYSLIDARFEAEDLFFLVNAAPEIPEPGNGMTQIAIQQNVSNSRDFMLNILNNVVNRIIISADENFTYHDEVYISSVLRKIGITDIAFFMKQVRELRSDNINIYNLLKLYSENIPKLAPALKTEAPEEKDRLPEAEKEEALRLPQPRYTIHNEIYKRLQTAEIYNIIHSYNNTKVQSNSYIASAELHTAEQLRVSNQLALSQLKQQFIGINTAELHHMHINRYELGEDLPPPQTEREVLTLSAAGVLLNLIDNATALRVENLSRNESLWLNISNAVYGAAQRSLERFQAFHTHQSFYSGNDIKIEARLRELSKKEETLLLRMSDELPQAEVPAAEIRLAQNEAEEAESYGESVLETESRSEKTIIETAIESKLSKISEKENSLFIKTQQMLEGVQPAEINLPQTLEEAEKPAQILEGRDTGTVREQVREKFTELVRAVNRERAEAAAGKATPKDVITEIIQNRFKTLNRITNEQGLLQNIFNVTEFITKGRIAEKFNVPPDEAEAAITRYLMQEGELSAEPKDLKGEEEPRVTLEALKVLLEDAGLKSGESKAVAESIISKTLNQFTAGQDFSSHNISNIIQNISKTAGFESAGAEQEEMQLSAIAGHLEQQAAHSVQPEEARNEGLPQAQTAQSMKAQLDEFDRRNKEKAQELTEKINNFARPEAAKPDSAKVIADSLKALENPAQALSEIFNSEAEFKHPSALLPEEEIALSVADEATRIIYESIIKQRQNPDISGAAQDAGARIQAFNAEIQEIEKTRQTEIIHHAEKLREETETVFNNTNTIIEQYRTNREAAPLKLPGVFRSPALTIHKAEQQAGIPEELIEQLIHKKTETRHETVNIEKTVNKSLTETEVNTLIKEQTAKSTEDITALVNSTIARQLGTISERVYSNMERRLSLERARRGK
jgi:hypothetical protein